MSWWSGFGRCGGDIWGSRPSLRPTSRSCSSTCSMSRSGDWWERTTRFGGVSLPHVFDWLSNALLQARRWHVDGSLCPPYWNCNACRMQTRISCCRKQAPLSSSVWCVHCTWVISCAKTKVSLPCSQKNLVGFAISGFMLIFALCQISFIWVFGST